MSPWLFVLTQLWACRFPQTEAKVCWCSWFFSAVKGQWCCLCAFSSCFPQSVLDLLVVSLQYQGCTRAPWRDWGPHPACTAPSACCAWITWFSTQVALQGASREITLCFTRWGLPNFYFYFLWLYSDFYSWSWSLHLKIWCKSLFYHRSWLNHLP